MFEVLGQGITQFRAGCVASIGISIDRSQQYLPEPRRDRGIRVDSATDIPG